MKSAIEGGTALKGEMNSGIPNEWKIKNGSVLRKKIRDNEVTVTSSEKTSSILQNPPSD